jgi:Ca-activated chloride channel family protein
MHFQNPWLFTLLPVVLALAFYSRKRGQSPSFLFSSGELVKGLKQTWRIKLSKGAFLLRAVALILIVIALCRPQSMIKETEIHAEGIDIVLAIDTSTSMRAEDFQLDGKRANRLEAVKDVVKEFIRNRHDDRIGIIAFAARAYTVSPLTLDYGWLMRNLERVEIGMIEDGTAIGSGISSALNRLKDTEAKGKVVVLLTDGRNNAGRISPVTAAEAASSLNIKVYTVGAGTKGLAPYPTKDFFGNIVYQPVRIDIDDERLKKIAEKTDANYYRATDTESLRNIYREIDRLEKTPIEERGYIRYKELFSLFLIPALILLIMEVVFKNTLLRKIP